MNIRYITIVLLRTVITALIIVAAFPSFFEEQYDKYLVSPNKGLYLFIVSTSILLIIVVSEHIVLTLKGKRW